MKPDARIYQIAMQRLGVSPSESVFVDDFSENIEGAKKVGMPALHFTDPEIVQRKLVDLTGVK